MHKHPQCSDNERFRCRAGRVLWKWTWKIFHSKREGASCQVWLLVRERKRFRIIVRSILGCSLNKTKHLILNLFYTGSLNFMLPKIPSKFTKLRKILQVEVGRLTFTALKIYLNQILFLQIHEYVKYSITFFLFLFKWNEVDRFLKFDPNCK